MKASLTIIYRDIFMKLFFLPLVALSVLVISSAADPRPADLNGRLSLMGTQLVNAAGNPIQLRGMSTHGLNWYGEFYRAHMNGFDTLATTWGADIIRFSMYIHEYDNLNGKNSDGEVTGYLADATPVDSFTLTSIHKDTTYYRVLMDTLIDKAKDLGVYALVDWHMLQCGNPNVYDINNPKDASAAACNFFDYISKKHASQGNVLYEICNEPSGSSGSWKNISTYANKVIPVIRKNDPDGIIIVGTPGFSASLDLVDTSMINNRHNVMYTEHIYMDRSDADMTILQDAVDNGIPVFVTEWGCQNSDGDGSNDLTLANRWVNLWAQNGVSWIMWNYSPDSLSGAAWDPSLKGDVQFVDANLKESGLYVKDLLSNPPDNFPGTTPILASRVAQSSIIPAMNISGATVRIQSAMPLIGRLNVYDLRGRVVYTSLLNGQTFLWDARSTGIRGALMLKLETPQGSTSMRMLNVN